MVDPFIEQAARLRERYVSFYRRSIEELTTEPGLVVELLVQPNGRTTPAPFCLTRLDILSGTSDAPRIQRIADSREATDNATFRLPNGLQIDQHAFSWEALRLKFSGARFKLETLQTWLATWLDVAEVREPDRWGLSGIVHDVAWTHEHDVWQLDVDLGSAPVNALEELFGIIANAGVTSLELSRSDAGDA